MRIAFVSFETVHHRDTETNERLHTVVQLLHDHGHDVHVFCAKFWPEDRTTADHDGITFHGIASGLDARWSFLCKLPFALRSIRPDVIHASADPPGGVLAANWGSTLARVPLVVEWYGDEGVPDDRRHREVARRGDRIVTPSRLVATWVRELGASGDRVTVTPTPIDLDRIQDTEPGETVDVIYARRLDEGANLESLLLGLAELRDRGWRATVLGDGPKRAEYERLASDLRIDDRVSFAGAASRDERIAAYRSAHVFAQTSDRCVFPTEMLWALAAGCVGIVEYHANSSAHELVEGWERGFRTTSERELANAILEAGTLEHRDFDESFAEYDRRAVSRRYLETYHDLREEYGLR